MDPWYKKITDKYPNLYPPNFHFECDEGWSSILENLSEKITSIPIQITVSQVKEKFGGLRFYINPYFFQEEIENPDPSEITKEELLVLQIDRYIADAESASYKTCEVCGEPGTLGGKYWVSTLCERHRLH